MNRLEGISAKTAIMLLGALARAALFAAAKVVGARAAAVFMVSDLPTQDGWTGLVKGRHRQDLPSLARVVQVFRLLQPGKRYNRERTVQTPWLATP
jgi:hypothetical protein